MYTISTRHEHTMDNWHNLSAPIRHLVVGLIAQHISLRVVQQHRSNKNSFDSKFANHFTVIWKTIDNMGMYYLYLHSILLK